MNKIRVAIVEDNDLTLTGLRITFQQCDAIEMVGEATDGLKGLALLEATRPDVAIVDIGLPLLDGIELTRKFKQTLSAAEPSESSASKVMMLTMQDDEDAVFAAFAAGADSYCMKDLSTSSLLRALQSTYEGENWIDPTIARIVLQHNRQTWQAKAARDSSMTNKIAISSDDVYNQVIKAYPLTDRELEVLELIVAGCSNAAIGSKLFVTVGTVKTHVRNILNKLCVDDRTQAAVRALRSGLIA